MEGFNHRIQKKERITFLPTELKDQLTNSLECSHFIRLSRIPKVTAAAAGAVSLYRVNSRCSSVCLQPLVVLSPCQR